MFRELLAIELEIKSPDLTKRLLGEYESRFPNYSSEIRQVIREMDETGNHPQPDTSARKAGSGLRTERIRVFEEGTKISDRYTLDKQIGEGGMGEVWIAIQTKPVKRKVAIKLINTGMDSRAVIARFEQERQALAMMDHPNIARVFDAGMTSTGLPFFVMEWVDGLPLNEFCDQGKLTPRERLELFVPICQAVQHAHQKEIVHRDLKPTNIIVSEVDGKAVPKVIDFGVAKATRDKPTDLSIVTQFGNVVGTFAYMSPEQAGSPDIDIDTRADIYSLGVVLYELLTGLRPIDVQRFQDAGLPEMVRVIQEEEPSRPSTKLSSNESLPSLAAVRSVEPKRLAAMLRGELDWIVMKCLEKTRDRRYETANALARDVQRYLSDEPVEARPPSSGYLLAKFLRRNKGPVVAASTICLALVAGIAGTSFGLFRAEGARLEAEKQTTLALEAGAKEKEANARAQKRLGQIENSHDILGSIFQSLDPREIAETNRPLQAILVERLKLAAQQLEGDAIGDPVMVATMQSQLAQSLHALSAPKEAIALFEKSHETLEAELGPNDQATIAGLHNLATEHLAGGNPDLAIPLFETTLRRRIATVSHDDPSIANSRIGLARAHAATGDFDVAVPLLEDVVKQQTETLGAGHADTLGTIEVLAVFYRDTGKPFLALELLEEIYKQQKNANGLNHPDTLQSMNNLADGYHSVGRIDRAQPLYQRAYELMKAALGENHRLTLSTMGNLASLYKEVGEIDIALPLLKERLKRSKAVLGADHPDTLLSMANLASGYQAAGNKKLAFSLCQETLELSKEKLGPDHPNTLLSMNNLAMSHQANGELDLALPLYKDALARMKVKLEPKHPATLTCMGNLAAIYQDMGKIDLALPLFEEALELEKATLGPQHPNTLRTMNNLAVGYWTTQQLDKSVPLFRDLVDHTSSLLGRDHPNTLMTIVNLGVNLKDSGQVQESLPLLEEGYRAGKQYPPLLALAGPQLLDGYAQAEMTESASELAKEFVDSMRGQTPKESLELAELLAQTGSGLLEAKAYSEAEVLLAESLSIRENKAPDSWLKFNMESLLGAALLGQNKYTEAEPLLVSGYDGMKNVAESIPEHSQFYLLDALKRLIRCYEETGDEEKAAIRRAELESDVSWISEP